MVGVGAVTALFEVAAQGCGAAGLDGSHHPQLIERQGMRLPVAGTVFSKNVSQLNSGPRHGERLALWFRVGLAFGPARVQTIERTHRAAHDLR